MPNQLNGKEESKGDDYLMPLWAPGPKLQHTDSQHAGYLLNRKECEGSLHMGFASPQLGCLELTTSP